MLIALPAPPRPFRPLAILILLSALSACSHSDAFSPHGNATSEPHVDAVPTVLTYNTADDLTPAWLPDGSGFIYAFGTTTRERDQCLGVMPATGGRLTEEICNPGVKAVDSTDTFVWPAVSSGNLLAYMRSSRPVSAQKDLNAVLVTAPLANPNAVTRLRTFPYQGPDAFYLTATSPAWLSESRLAFIGMVDTNVPCENQIVCQFITIRSGHDIVVAELTGGAALMQTISDTKWASSVAASSDPAVVYYTTAGSSKVFQFNVSGGGATAIHDFGTAGIARDVHAAGGKMAAIVGGVVKIWSDGLTTDPIQQDAAGRLFIVDMGSGAEQEIAVPEMLFRHPALSPDGSRVVVEAHPINVSVVRDANDVIIRVDTLVLGGIDLWEFPTE